MPFVAAVVFGFPRFVLAVFTVYSIFWHTHRHTHTQYTHTPHTYISSAAIEDDAAVSGAGSLDDTVVICEMNLFKVCSACIAKHESAGQGFGMGDAAAAYAP